MNISLYNVEYAENSHAGIAKSFAPSAENYTVESMRSLAKYAVLQAVLNV